MQVTPPDTAEQPPTLFSNPAPLRAGEDLLAWVGPEGGFAAEEREALEAACEIVLDLGPQRLRAETAALAVACRLLLPTMATKPRGAR